MNNQETSNVRPLTGLFGMTTRQTKQVIGPNQFRFVKETITTAEGTVIEVTQPHPSKLDPGVLVASAKVEYAPSKTCYVVGRDDMAELVGALKPGSFIAVEGHHNYQKRSRRLFLSVDRDPQVLFDEETGF